MIKAGDKFKCIKDVIMDDDPNDIAYYADNIYVSEKDECITDEQGYAGHKWYEYGTTEGNNMKDYFIKLPKESILQESISQKEMVNHPEHYYNGKFECIEVMLDVFDKDKVADFCELNAFKYLWRADNKGTDIQDKKKAIWYLNKYIKLKEEV